MGITKTYSKIAHIKSRKEHHLQNLIQGNLTIPQYSEVLRKLHRKVKDMENAPELYPNLWLEIITLKKDINLERKMISKLGDSWLTETALDIKKVLQTKI